MSYFMQEEFYKAHTNEIQHTLFSIFFQASNNESLISWVPRYQRVLDFKYLIFTFLYWSYICQRSKGHVECWSIWLVVRAASLPNSVVTQRTSILDLDSGTWVRNVIFSRLDDNLVGRSVDHPRCCRRWSVGHLRCCEDGGNLRFSRQAAEVLAWLRERTFTGEKLLGTRSLPCSSVLRQNASLWSALLLKFHSHHCRVEESRKGPDRKLWLVSVLLH